MKTLRHGNITMKVGYVKYVYNDEPDEILIDELGIISDEVGREYVFDLDELLYCIDHEEIICFSDYVVNMKKQI